MTNNNPIAINANPATGNGAFNMRGIIAAVDPAHPQIIGPLIAIHATVFACPTPNISTRSTMATIPTQNPNSSYTTVNLCEQRTPVNRSPRVCIERTGRPGAAATSFLAFAVNIIIQSSWSVIISSASNKAFIVFLHCFILTLIFCKSILMPQSSITSGRC